MVTVLTPPRVTPARDAVLASLKRARGSRFRPMRKFAEEEIRLPPGGEFEGGRFNCQRQPFAALWFAALVWAASVGIQRYMAYGPTQTGKTLLCFAIPAIYHAVEQGYRVIIGVPDMNMAGDKWSDDLLPVLEETKYRELLPLTGGGSRGGKNVTRVQLANGGLFRFMTGQSRGAGKMGFTAPIIMMTELNELAVSSGDKRLSDSVKLLEGRARGVPSQRRIYGESTHTDESGRIHREAIVRGSATSIALRCPHCSNLVVPDRKHLVGWRGQTTLAEVREHAALACPSCAARWSEADRRVANERAVLVHRGQSLEGGEVTGDPEVVDTLGFGWSCVNSMFDTMRSVAEQEWRAEQAEDPDNAEKELCQQVWGRAYESATMKMPTLEAARVRKRVRPIPRGTVPDHALYVTYGADLRTTEMHYSAWAWWIEDGRPTGNEIDYGILPVPSQSMELSAALRSVILSFGRDVVLEGLKTTKGDRRVADQAWIDAMWEPDEVCAAIKELEGERDGRDGALFRPYQGRGEGQHQSRKYDHPKSTSKQVIWVGTQHHVVWDDSRQICIVVANADWGKDRVQEGLAAPFKGGRLMGSPGALALHDAPPVEHRDFVIELLAEVRRVEWDELRGEVVRWVKKHARNHFGDTAWAALMAFMQLFDAERQADKQSSGGEVYGASTGGDVGESGAYLITQREEL